VNSPVVREIPPGVTGADLSGEPRRGFNFGKRKVEMKQNAKPQVCGACGGSGHNARSCKKSVKKASPKPTASKAPPRTTKQACDASSAPSMLEVTVRVPRSLVERLVAEHLLAGGSIR